MTGQKFEHWLLTVDNALYKRSGLTHTDFEGIDWHELWASGIAGAHAARKVLLEVFGEL